MTSAPDDSSGQDGRTTRWDAHRRMRRAELVEAAVAAVRDLGPSPGMDDFATYAGTSKTVLYRHFTDRAGLHQAVAELIETQAVTEISRKLAAEPSFRPRDLIKAAIGAYVNLIVREPNLYRFVVTNWSDTRAAGGATGSAAAEPGGRVAVTVKSQIAGLLRMSPAITYLPAGCADLWGHAIVGMVRTAVDRWLEEEVEMSTEDLIEVLTELTWHGTSAAVHYRPAASRGTA